MEKIKISELKSNDTISNLIPEMTEKEFLDLKTSISDNGLRHPIDINKDNTILDGRHRVRVFKSLGYENIPFTRHDLTKDEAIEFVRDTAVERRNLTSAQRLAIIEDANGILSDIFERAKQNKRDAMKKANKSNPNHQGDGCSPIGEQRLTTTKVNTTQEVAKLAGVGTSTVSRARKIKKENPEAYQKVVEGKSTWSKEYDNLPSVKNYKPKPVKEAVPSDKEVKKVKVEPKVEIKQDSRHSINEFYSSRKKGKPEITKNEDIAIEVVNTCLALESALEEVSDKDVFSRYLSTPDHIEVVTRVAKKLIKTIKEV